ncbi:MAG: hypothetical protein QOG47_3335 [Mycobacterium sp.]|jgi:hypothetical protein|nr:hypothetical protein [Mycobacterium sp.]MDT5090628.1 hypothetical protein [Mycobacterium sp.]MDT5206699.1 hypothetical protein [Mycobacterium sp.]
MSTVRTFVRATAVVAGSSAALLMGGLMGTAHADPAPLPAPNIGEQLVGTAANAPQVLQNVAGALGGQPATPPPLASAAIKMPQQAATTTPGATSLLPGLASPTPATSATPGLGIPGLTSPAPAATSTPGLSLPGLTPTAPAATAPATNPAGMLPQAQLNLPQIPGLPFPLPQQVSLPGDLTALLTGGSPLTGGLASAAGIPAASLPTASLPAASLPAASLPLAAAPVLPAAAGASLFPVSALP